MSFSEFSDQDYRIIEEAYNSLKKAADARCRNEKEVEMVRKAFDFANNAHKNVRRRSGEPYMVHPIAVAKIVIEDIGLGYKSICAALLHDVVEDTSYTVEDIRNLFGNKIASLVDGLTKIKTVLDNEDRKGPGMSTESMQAENFKRILLTMGDDVRVVLIKLADRLHNCRTIESMPEHKRDKILSETMFIFIPLAHRLGLYGVKSEMENIWLKYKEPEAYEEIVNNIERVTATRKEEIEHFVEPIDNSLRLSGFDFTIKKRVKTPYSIWYKMHTKKVPFDQIYDLYAIRIIYNPKDDKPQSERNEAYLIYSTITNLFSENPGRRRDWISQPKSNGYEALHCTLMSHAGIWIEVQIRSRRMNDIAEKGIAAHWAYKNDGYISENDSEMEKWLSEIQDILVSDEFGAMEFLDIIHRDLVSTEIVVFTPKGEQRSIRNGATALDFAYQIHTHIGEQAIAAKVNMKLVPLSTVLKSGDQVEIITTASGRPKLEWLRFLQTRHAKNKVIEYFRSKHEEISAEGAGIFEARLNSMNLTPSNELMRKFLDHAQLRDVNELYFRMGLGLIGPEEFRRIVTEAPLAEGTARDRYIISANGTGQRQYIMADCCNPIPGDPVVGFLTADGTVVVHKKSCVVADSLASKYGNRVVSPEWAVKDTEYPIRISLKGLDRVGILNDITNFISQTLGINMKKLQLSTDDGVFEGYIELLVKDKKSLEDMVEGMKVIDGIQDVVRTDI